MAEAVGECEARVAAEMGGAMASLQDESERLIGQLEAKLAATKAERDERARELAGAQEQVEEHGDTIYDLTKVLKAAEAGGGEGALKGFGEARRSGSRAQLKRDRG